MLTIHAIFAFDLFRQRLERELQRELAYERLKEKPKRQHMAIGDDDELVDIQEQTLAARSFEEKTYGH